MALALAVVHVEVVDVAEGAPGEGEPVAEALMQALPVSAPLAVGGAEGVGEALPCGDGEGVPEGVSVGVLSDDGEGAPEGVADVDGGAVEEASGDAPVRALLVPRGEPVLLPLPHTVGVVGGETLPRGEPLLVALTQARSEGDAPPEGVAVALPVPLVGGEAVADALVEPNDAVAAEVGEVDGVPLAEWRPDVEGVALPVPTLALGVALGEGLHVTVTLPLPLALGAAVLKASTVRVGARDTAAERLPVLEGVALPEALLALGVALGEGLCDVVAVALTVELEDPVCEGAAVRDWGAVAAPEIVGAPLAVGGEDAVGEPVAVEQPVALADCAAVPLGVALGHTLPSAVGVALPDGVGAPENVVVGLPHADAVGVAESSATPATLAVGGTGDSDVVRVAPLKERGGELDAEALPDGEGVALPVPTLALGVPLGEGLPVAAALPLPQKLGAPEIVASMVLRGARDAVTEALPVTEGVPLPVLLKLALGVALGEKLSVVVAVALPEELGDPDTVSAPLAVGAGDAVRALVAVVQPVALAVCTAVPLVVALGHALPRAVGLALPDGVGATERVVGALPLADAEGVEESSTAPATLRVGASDVEPDAVAALAERGGEPVADAEPEVEGEALPEALLALGVALGEGLCEGVALALWDALCGAEAVCRALLLGHDAVAVPLPAPEGDGREPLGRALLVALADGVGETSLLALGAALGEAAGESPASAVTVRAAVGGGEPEARGLAVGAPDWEGEPVAQGLAVGAPDGESETVAVLDAGDDAETEGDAEAEEPSKGEPLRAAVGEGDALKDGAETVPAWVCEGVQTVHTEGVAASDGCTVAEGAAEGVEQAVAPAVEVGALENVPLPEGEAVGVACAVGDAHAVEAAETVWEGLVEAVAVSVSEGEPVADRVTAGLLCVGLVEDAAEPVRRADRDRVAQDEPVGEPLLLGDPLYVLAMP